MLLTQTMSLPFSLLNTLAKDLVRVRYERMKTRRSETLIREEAQVAVEEHAEIDVVLHQGQEADKGTEEEADEQEEEQVEKELEEERYDQEEAMEAGNFLVDPVDRGTQTDGTSMIDYGTQKDDNSEKMMKKYKALSATVFGMSMIEGNNAATKFIFACQAGACFFIFIFLSPFVTPSKSVQLDVELLAVLVRLRLNLFMVDLASRLGISNGTMVNIFQKWLNVMFVRLKFLITWPSREILQNNMPLVFQQLYPNCRVIIDCSEIFTETPASFDARAKTYSNYKKHNTVKFLIGVTPCGTISYLSHFWGGRVSDKNITQESDFLS